MTEQLDMRNVLEALEGVPMLKWYMSKMKKTEKQLKNGDKIHKYTLSDPLSFIAVEITSLSKQNSVKESVQNMNFEMKILHYDAELQPSLDKEFYSLYRGIIESGVNAGLYGYTLSKPYHQRVHADYEGDDNGLKTLLRDLSVTIAEIGVRPVIRQHYWKIKSLEGIL